MALFTTDQIKSRLPAYTGTDQDTLIADLAGSADDLMAEYCGFPVPDGATQHTLQSATYTLYLDGPVEYGRPDLDTQISPVISITSVHDDPDHDYGATSLRVAGTDYDAELPEGMLWRRPAGQAWSRSYRAQKVVLVAGFATPLPDTHPLIELGAAAVRAMLAQPHTQGRQSVAGAGLSVQLAEPDHPLPLEVRRGLRRYQLGRALAY